MRRYRIRNLRIAPRPRHLERRRGLLKNASHLLLILVVLSFLGRWFHEFLRTSSSFNIEKIEIQGLNRLKEKEIRALLSLEPSQNIFAINPKRIRERIETHPRIKEAVVHRRPPKRVAIQIREREPLALISQGGDLLGIDSSGVPFPLIEPLKGIDLPFITGIESSGIIIGEESNSTNLRMALEILTTILSLKGDLYRQVSEINVEDGITLYTTEGATRVHMGREDFWDQLYNLQGVLIHLNREKKRAEYIDLRFKDKVIVK